MHVTHTTEIRLDDDEQFEVDAVASFSGSRVRVRVAEIKHRVSTHGVRTTVSGPKPRKDGTAGQWTKDAEIDGPLPEVLAAIIKGATRSADKDA